MKHLSKLFSGFFILSLIFLLPYPAEAQENNDNEEITHGLEYWVGIPHCRKSAGEPIRFGEFPIMLWLSSKVNTQATVTIKGLGTTNHNIKEHQTTIVKIPDVIMNRESEVITEKGIHIEADDPITVAVYMAYKWSGECYRAIPVEWLGKKYVTANLYLDALEHYKPAQFVITATQNKTKVTYKPTANTVKVDAGHSNTVVLDKGETYLVEGRIEGMKYQKQTWSTDLTGTYIEADKPISVISGHTKGAFPRYQRGMPTNYQFRWAVFSKNMLIEMLWPIELLGKEYISAPIRYHDRERGLSGHDDYGDLIRIIAAYDETEVFVMRQNGSGFKRIGPELNRGDWFNLESQEEALYYKSTKPILMAQYGKSWWNMSIPGGPDDSNKDKADEIQNPTRSGQGMMLVLAPKEHWTSYAQFRSPYGIDNFIYMTFKRGDQNHITFDGQPLTGKFGTAMNAIEGTDYFYITEEVGPGDHHVEADSGVKFACYAYGNWDATKDGFAYGYPTGINYASVCEDTLLIEDDDTCGNVTGRAWVEPEDSSCAILFSIRFIEDESYNYEADIENFDPATAKEATFMLTVKDLSKSAKAVMRFMTRSGMIKQKTYTYIPEDVVADPDSIHFGTLTLNEKKCVPVKLKNPADVPVTIYELTLKHQYPEFEINSPDLPVTIPPKGEVEIEACATALKQIEQTITDTLLATLSCFKKAVLELKMGSGEPIIHVTDQEWVDIPIFKEVPKSVWIKNVGNKDLIVEDIDWDDKTHFTKVENLREHFPLTLKPDENHEFTVYYRPNEAGVTDIDTAHFISNAGSNEKSWSEWKGIGIDAEPIIDGYDFGKRRIVKPHDGKNDSSYYEWNVNYGCIATNDAAKLHVRNIYIEDDTDGVFRLDENNMIIDLTKGQFETLPLFFEPKEEKAYNAKVIIEAKFSELVKYDTAQITGTGIQPHVEIKGYEWTELLTVGDTRDGDGWLTNIIKSDAGKTQQLVIDDLVITGPDANAFEVKQSFMDQMPVYVDPGDSLAVPYTFTAMHNGRHAALVQTVSNSWNPAEDSDSLIGIVAEFGLTSNDRDFGLHYVTLDSTDTVYLQNQSSETIQVLEEPTITGNDPQYFTLDRYYVESTGQTPAQVPFDLQSQDKLISEVTFRTFDTGDTAVFNAQIDYKTSIDDYNDVEPQTSNLTGEAMVHKIVPWIDDDYNTSPIHQDEYVQEIEVMMKNRNDEKKPLHQANILGFTTDIKFTRDNQTSTIDVFPAIDDKDLGDSIITDETMTEGWSLDQAAIINDEILRVTMSQSDPNRPLAVMGEGVLFKFKLLPYLSDTATVPLPIVTFEADPPYVLEYPEPGQITIQPVCVNTLRLIESFGIQYSMSDVAPNPIDGNSTATINYSIGLESFTTIALYNSYGEKVGTFVNQKLKPGEYELSINISRLDLPSGVYYYKIKSGPYTETKPMVISK